MDYLPTTRMDVYLEYKSNISRALSLQIPARLNRLARGYSARHRARMGDQGTSGMGGSLTAAHAWRSGNFPCTPPIALNATKEPVYKENTHKRNNWGYRITRNTSST